MSKIGLVHMTIGFSAIFLSAAGGAFLATDTAEAFIRDPQIMDSWSFLILRSAHGHTSLFGQIHILLALTLPYCRTTKKFQTIQLIFFTVGTFAMSVLMLLRAWEGPSLSTDPIGLVTGAALSLALVAIMMQIYGLWLKIKRV